MCRVSKWQGAKFVAIYKQAKCVHYAGDMSHHHHHHHRKSSQQESSGPTPFFRKRWVFVVAVILMLIAMAVYVLTLDDSTVEEPGEPPVQQAADF